MKLKEDILELLRNNSPITDKEMVEHLDVLEPSLRRARNDLVKSGKIKRVGDKLPASWALRYGKARAVTAAKRSVMEEHPHFTF